MKRLILLSFSLLLAFGVGRAQHYIQTETRKFEEFLKQESCVIDQHENPPLNGDVIFGENWQDLQWKESEIAKSIIKWEDDGDHDRIIEIDIQEISGSLSGTLDLSGCTKLERVTITGKRLTSVDLSGCANLKIVDLGSNRISEANFLGCDVLEQLYLDDNCLLPSMIHLDLLPFDFSFHSQRIDCSGFTIVEIQNEICIGIYLQEEIKFHGYGYTVEENENIIPLEQKNIRYYKVKDIQNLLNDLGDIELLLYRISYSKNANSDADGSVEWYFDHSKMKSINMIFWNLPKGYVPTFYFYLLQDEIPILIETVSSYESSFHTSLLPFGDYLISAEASDYLFTYYHEDMDEELGSVVTDWNSATRVQVNEKPSDGEFPISFKPIDNSSGNSTIRGYISDKRIMRGIPVLPRNKATVILQKSTDLFFETFTTCATTGFNSTNYYEFNHLPEGLYRVMVDVPGYNMENHVEFVVENKDETFHDQNFVIDKNSKTIKAVDNSKVFLYHEHDSVKLLNFLTQRAPEQNSMTNAQVLLGDRVLDANWQETPGWIALFDGYFIWTPESEDENAPLRISEILIDGANDYFLYGTIDFADCKGLYEANLSHHFFTDANFYGCDFLNSINLSYNQLTSVNFTGCTRMEQLLLDNNCLLPSMISLDAPPPVFSFFEQRIDCMRFPLLDIQGEIYVGINVSEEIHFWEYQSEESSWIDHHYNDDGVLYINFKDIQNKLNEKDPAPDFDPFLVLYSVIFKDNSDRNGSVEWYINYNRMGTISIDLMGQEAITSTAYIFLLQDDIPVLIEIVMNEHAHEYITSGLLPYGEYLISVDASGYLFTYYDQTMETGVPLVVADWNNAGRVTIDENILIRMNLMPFIPNTKGNITLSGRILVSANKSALKASVIQKRKSTVVIQTASGSVPVATVEPIEMEDGNWMYIFEGLEEGTYIITVDIAGYDMIEPIIIDANTIICTYSNLDFIIDETNKTITGYYLPLSAPEWVADETQLYAYPNPTTGMIRIDGLPGAYTVRIINMQGQAVASVMGTSPELTLHLDGQPSGMYLIRIESEGKTYVMKVIKY